MRYQPELFKTVLPSIRGDLLPLGGHVPQLLDAYDGYVRRLGEHCIYARATLKLLYLEANNLDQPAFELALRNGGYS